jgi:hypothetical protein
MLRTGGMPDSAASAFPPDFSPWLYARKCEEKDDHDEFKGKIFGGGSFGRLPINGFHDRRFGSGHGQWQRWGRKRRSDADFSESNCSSSGPGWFAAARARAQAPGSPTPGSSAPQQWMRQQERGMEPVGRRRQVQRSARGRDDFCLPCAGGPVLHGNGDLQYPASGADAGNEVTRRGNNIDASSHLTFSA